MEVKKFIKSFTLIEVLMATSIFTAIGLIAIAIFININNLQLRSNMENALYEDARFMMARLSRAVRNNAIDYEEYFNQELGNCKQYGDTYGAYAAQFYNPGAMKDGEKNNITPAPNGDYGAFCNDGTPYTGQQNCVVYKPSVDNNTGQFPIPTLKNKGGKGELASNAFCPAALSSLSCKDSTASGINIKKQLYLISPNGKKKIIFALKQVNNTPKEYALAKLSLTGKDKNHDGITNQWRDPNGNYYCSTGFQCPSTLHTLKSTLKVKNIGLYEGFVPISPIRSTVSNLDFIINPKDDPHKAFAEKNLEQPHVIIIMTLKPSDSEMSKFPTAAAVPSITLETIVTSRVQTEVKSYLGYGTENIGNELSIGKISNGWQCS